MAETVNIKIEETNDPRNEYFTANTLYHLANHRLKEAQAQVEILTREFQHAKERRDMAQAKVEAIREVIDYDWLRTYMEEDFMPRFMDADIPDWIVRAAEDAIPHMSNQELFNIACDAGINVLRFKKEV